MKSWLYWRPSSQPANAGNKQQLDQVTSLGKECQLYKLTQECDRAVTIIIRIKILSEGYFYRLSSKPSQWHASRRVTSAEISVWLSIQQRGSSRSCRLWVVPSVSDNVVRSPRSVSNLFLSGKTRRSGFIEWIQYTFVVISSSTLSLLTWSIVPTFTLQQSTGRFQK